MKKKFVNVMIGMMTTALFCACLVGCGSSEQTAADTAEVQEETQEISEEAPEENETAQEEPSDEEMVGDEEMMEEYPANFMEERIGQYSFDSYEEIISDLETGEAYGYAAMLGADEDVLMITNEPFNGYDAPACMVCYPYIKNAEGKYVCGGVFSTVSTATPIAVSEDGRIFEATHDSMSIYAIDPETKGIMVMEYATVTWGEKDEDNVYGGFIRSTNSVAEDGTEIAEDDSAPFDAAFAEYENTTPIAFTILGQNAEDNTALETVETEDFALSYDSELFYGYVPEGYEEEIDVNYLGECAGTSMIIIARTDYASVEEALDDLAADVEITDPVSFNRNGCEVWNADKVIKEDNKGVILDDAYYIFEMNDKVFVVDVMTTRDTDKSRAEAITEAMDDVLSTLTVK